MSALRLGIIISGSLILGFAAGWFLHQSPASASPLPSAVAVLYATPAADRAASAIKTDPASTQETQPAPTNLPTANDHLAALRSLKAFGLLPHTGFFQGSKLDPQFVSLYGLTSPETARLNVAGLHAKQILDELCRQHARLDPSSSPEKLVVTIPAFPKEGGKIYNDLLAEISTVLGADRYAFFDQTSGGALDTAYDGFGLTKHRYEVVLLKESDGHTSYKITGSSVYDAIDYRAGVGTSSDGFWTTGDATSLKKDRPLLEPYPFPKVPIAPVK